MFSDDIATQGRLRISDIPPQLMNGTKSNLRLGRKSRTENWAPSSHGHKTLDLHGFYGWSLFQTNQRKNSTQLHRISGIGVLYDAKRVPYYTYVYIYITPYIFIYAFIRSFIHSFIYLFTHTWTPIWIDCVNVLYTKITKKCQTIQFLGSISLSPTGLHPNSAWPELAALASEASAKPERSFNARGRRKHDRLRPAHVPSNLTWFTVISLW